MQIFHETGPDGRPQMRVKFNAACVRDNWAKSIPFDIAAGSHLVSKWDESGMELTVRAEPITAGNAPQGVSAPVAAETVKLEKANRNELLTEAARLNIEVRVNRDSNSVIAAKIAKKRAELQAKEQETPEHVQV